MAEKKIHFEVALVRVPEDTARSKLIGTSRDQDLAAIVHQALREELDDSFRLVDDASSELATA